MWSLIWSCQQIFSIMQSVKRSVLTTAGHCGQKAGYLLETSWRCCVNIQNSSFKYSLLSPLCHLVSSPFFVFHPPCLNSPSISSPLSVSSPLSFPCFLISAISFFFHLLPPSCPHPSLFPLISSLNLSSTLSPFLYSCVLVSPPP